MNYGIIYLAAIVVIIGAELVLMKIFEERHFMLKYLFIMGILVAALFIPTVIYEIPKHCDTVVNTSSIAGNVTSYTYQEVCFTTTTTIPDTFYEVYAWIDYIFIAYFIIRIFYDLYMHYFKGRRWTDWPGWFR